MLFEEALKLWTHEERMVRDTVRAWVTERYLPLCLEHFENGTFPHELTPELVGRALAGFRFAFGLAAGAARRQWRRHRKVVGLAA